MKITNDLPKEEVLPAGRSTCVAYFVWQRPAFRNKRRGLLFNSSVSHGKNASLPDDPAIVLLLVASTSFVPSRSKQKAPHSFSRW